MAQRIFTPREHPVDALTSVALLVLRVAAGGLLLASHGWPKLQRFGELSSTFADPIGLGPAASLTLVVGAEVLCAFLVIIGLGTRFAAVPIIVFLSIAAFVQHAADPWPKREFPLIFMVPFLAVLIAGGGRYAPDAMITRVIGRWPRT